jgi:Na+/H+ antiporter NhaA
MLSVISGLVVGSAGGATLWCLRARNGVIHPLVRNPWFEAPIAIGIAAAIAFGIAMIISGLA